jgi:hypothetical protein
MTTDNKPNPANNPTTVPPKPTQLPTRPGLPEREGDEKLDGAQQIADHLAHKGAKAEQDFDKDNSKLFSK